MESVSNKIRKIRRENNITLKELSERTDLSVSFLSQFERGVSSITLVSLKKIAEALNITMRELFDDGPEPDGRFVHRESDGTGIMGLEKKYAGYERLSGRFEGRKLESLLLRMEPLRSDFEPCTHEGEEFGYILSGSVSIHLGSRTYKAKKGESFYFTPDKKHFLTSKNGAVVLWVSSPPSF